MKDFRGLRNKKTKEEIELLDGQDAEKILAILPDPENWEYVCEERSLCDMNQPTDEQLDGDRKRDEYFRRPRKYEKPKL